MQLSGEARQILAEYKWPGNIREMENLIQSLIVTRDKNSIEPADLPTNMLPSLAINEDKSLNDMVDDFERELLKKALETHGSVAATARHLKVDRVTIYRKLKKYTLM